MTRHWSARLPKNAYLGAVVWCRTQPSVAAWKKCERGDWMLWMLARAKADRKRLVLAACDCAELADKYHNRKTRAAGRRALATARAWVHGKATLKEVRQTAAAAYSANAEAAADDAVYAAYAAVVCAAYAAVYAAHVAAVYAGRAARADRAAVLKRCAKIVRRHFPKPPKL